VLGLCWGRDPTNGGLVPQSVQPWMQACARLCFNKRLRSGVRWGCAALAVACGHGSLRAQTIRVVGCMSNTLPVCWVHLPDAVSMNMQ
jgi:hypothetical protein